MNFPKLQWDTEQKAVKQNMNVLILMLLGFVIGGLTIAAIVIANLSLWQAFGVIVVIYGAFRCVLYWLIKTYGISKFKMIEV